MQVEGGVTDGHGDGLGLVDVDPQFFEAFPLDGLVGQLVRLDMSVDEVPAVGDTTDAMDDDAPEGPTRRAQVQRLRAEPGRPCAGR